MPPTDTGPLSLSLYLTRLLAAMCLEHGGELRIPRAKVREITEEGARQMLVEDTNTETDEIVLRFGSKHSAVYPVEPECPITNQGRPTTSTTTSNPSSPQSRGPLNDEQLAALEKVQKYMKIKARMKPKTSESVTAQRELSEILGSNSTG